MERAQTQGSEGERSTWSHPVPSGSGRPEVRTHAPIVTPQHSATAEPRFRTADSLTSPALHASEAAVGGGPAPADRTAGAQVGRQGLQHALEAEPARAALPEGPLRLVAEAVPRVPSRRRLRNRGTEHVHKSSMKWMSSVQNDNATEP